MRYRLQLARRFYRSALLNIVSLGYPSLPQPTTRLYFSYFVQHDEATDGPEQNLRIGREKEETNTMHLCGETGGNIDDGK